jgi:LmbE family N-acetylglucosaminyl deacetylase
MLKIGCGGMRTVLCLGAHPDDIEIGCGGTILRILSEHKSLEVHWVILSSADNRKEEASQSARKFLKDSERKVVVHRNFTDSFFPYQGSEIKHYFNKLGKTISPDIIFTHRLEDRHQDHKLVSELTWNTFRRHLIMEYEIPKYEGDLGQPNIYVELSRELGERKIRTILDSFQSQSGKGWFTADTFLALLRLRGIEAKSAGGFAEGLTCRKMVIDFP